MKRSILFLIVIFAIFSGSLHAAATAMKTIEYAFPTNETLLTAVTGRFDFAAMTLYIPEATSRSFKSVIVEITTRDAQAAATSLTSWTIGIKLGAVAFDDVTVTDTIGNGGESQTFRFTRDVSTYFNTNFGAGTSQTVQVGYQFGAIDTTNTTCKLIITYAFDDTSQSTLIKTVRIPLENRVGANEANTLTETGTNQVPNLSTELPESSIVYRDIFFQIQSFEDGGGTTDAQACYALDAETADCTDNIEHGLGSGLQWNYIWKTSTILNTGAGTTSQHAFKSDCTQTGRLTPPAVILVVTYEYAASSSTIYNSILVPYYFTAGYVTNTAIGDLSRVQVPIFVEEPTTLTLKQSAVAVNFEASNAIDPTILIAVGGQTARSYAPNMDTTPGGSFFILHRFDSGGAAGSGLTLARGLNNINIDAYISTAGVSLPPFVNGLVMLNYTSGKATGCGSAGHNHTIIWDIADTAADLFSREIAAVGPTIPETNYFVNAVGFGQNTVFCLACIGAGVNAEVLSGEVPGDGWRTVLAMADSQLEDANVDIWSGVTNLFTQYPLDTRTGRMVLTTARKYRLLSFNEQAVAGNSWNWTNSYMMFTYHAVSFTSNKVISGYTGTGAGIDVRFYRSDTNEFLFKVTSTTGGNYSLVWYDNTITIYGESRQDDNHVGRSANFFAGT